MKFLSRLFKCLFWVLVLALLAAPIGLIYEISNREKQAYVVPNPPVFVETAYGTIAAAERMNVKESVLITGSFQSFTYVYMELTQRDPSQIRWNISVGDEIQTGQIIGMYKGDDVISECSGLVRDIQAYSSTNAYIKVQIPAPVVLVCDAAPGTLLSLKYAKAPSTQDGETVSLVYTADIRNSDGTTRIHLEIDSDDYFLNQAVEDMCIYTGNEYRNCLVLPKECLYQKTAGEKEPWYVRQVTEDGVFLEEIEVGRGYEDQNFVCVTGIQEGQFFDTGYSQFAKGGEPG